MKLIVGLGNPGDKYKDTRHNVGFLVADKLAHELGSPEAPWTMDEKRKAIVAKTGGIIIVKPQTFMNASGVAVKSIIDFYKVSIQDVWVIHDDIDLPLGKVRIRVGGSSAGHHGVDSIIRELHSVDFVRVRLGVGHGKENIGLNEDKHLKRTSVMHFVLSRFGRSEAGELKHLVKHGVEAVRLALYEGIDRAMNRFN